MFLVKKSAQLATFMMMFFSLSAFAADDAVNTGRFNSIAIDGYDTVAYFTQNRAVEGDKAFKVKWRDAYWYFDNKENTSFGPMTTNEWNNLFYKHLNHHLEQFKV